MVSRFRFPKDYFTEDCQRVFLPLSTGNTGSQVEMPEERYPGEYADPLVGRSAGKLGGPQRGKL